MSKKQKTAYNVTEKLINSHLTSGECVVGSEVGLKIDQTLTQDATGTMVMLELEAMGVKTLKTDVSCQYIDHNIVQNDFKNSDDHLFLWSAARKFGLYFSRPGNGVSHPVHMEQLGIPGKTLLGSDSHTCAAGSLGMLAIGAGGLEIALAMTGKSYHLPMPKIWGIKLVGKLNDWVSAKDVILELLKRHSVSGGVGKIIEYYGPGLKHLSAMDRHVIANMGAELGATTSVFPSDQVTKEFLTLYNRSHHWKEIVADPKATYDEYDEVDLSQVVPLIACPSSPDNVVPVTEVAGKEIFQAMIGSSANPGDRDFAIAAMMVAKKKVKEHVSFDINPTSRQVLENLIHRGYLTSLVQSGARIHQAGCNGCIGMGQAPATDTISLRTVPRNFLGRSGTKEDKVYLCSPETAAASALTGKITDPRTLGMPYPEYKQAKSIKLIETLSFPQRDSSSRSLLMGPNIKPLPKFSGLEKDVSGPVLLKLGDNISTDEILPAGSKVLPFRSNIPEISKFTFSQLDTQYYKRAIARHDSGSFIVGGYNYGQGSSREHAAIAPRYLAVKAIIAKSYARIHRKNLINFGIPPLLFLDSSDYELIKQDDYIEVPNLKQLITEQKIINVVHQRTKKHIQVSCELSDREKEAVLAGGLINVVLEKNEHD